MLLFMFRKNLKLQPMYVSVCTCCVRVSAEMHETQR